MVQAGYAVSLVLFVLRVFLGAMIFAHGYNKVFRGGRLAGTAGWFDSIGMKPGRLNAALAAVTELGVGVLLILGLATPLAAAGLVALMVVAIVTVHRFNGFFVFNKGQGIEYCLVVIAGSFVTGVLGGGKWSLDHLARHSQPWRWLDRPSHALLVTVVVGVGGAALQLLAVYRPPKRPSP